MGIQPQQSQVVSVSDNHINLSWYHVSTRHDTDQKGKSYYNNVNIYSVPMKH